MSSEQLKKTGQRAKRNSSATKGRGVPGDKATLTVAFTGNPQLLLAQWRLKSITLTLRVRVDYKMKRM